MLFGAHAHHPHKAGSHAASAQKYVDASTLTIIGRTCPMEGHPYYRVDTTRYRFDNATIRHYCGYPAGVAVLFTTDSRRIEARWTTVPVNTFLPSFS